jgi:formate-dependent nitrite reductase cytochrome c552 subunit
MTRALESGTDGAILRANPKLAVTLGAYSYRIERAGDQSIYSVTDGKETVTVPIEWAFGQGAAGQTYVFRLDGKWYESRVSYFSALRGLDLTMGGDPAPRNLTAAAGRLAPASEMRLCFDCHATNVLKSGPLSPENLVAGVQCERCHGPSQAHLSAGAPMKKVGALTTEQQSDFCGQCHRTWSQISLNGPRGIGNVRFQPYRLANSRCYDAADSRIKCTACHNPHRDVETSAAAYDAKCAACHSRAGARACKVASANCVTCHMPRLDLPGAHQKFTDHRIRIVRANAQYPD